MFRVGVIHQGGPYKAGVVNGLQDGLRQLGLEEGKQFSLNIRDSKGDLKAVEEAAKVFEKDHVNLIFAVTTSAVTPVKQVTSSDPDSFRRRQRPGRQRLCAKLRETRRQTRGSTIFDLGSHRKAAGDSQRDAAETQSDSNRL